MIATPPDAPPSGLRHHNVSVALTVGEGQDVAMQLAAIARQLGGTVGVCSTFQCTLKVPAERLGEAVQRISALGRADRPNVGVTDVAERYVDIQSRLLAIRRALDDLQTAAGRPGSVSDQLEVQSEQERLATEAAGLLQEARRLTQEALIANVSIHIEHPLRAAGENIQFRLPIVWLQKLGYSHLIDPPRTYEKGRAALDGRLQLGVGAPSNRDKLDAAATTWLGGHIRSGGSPKGSVVGWAMGIDFEMGAGFGSGFLYEMRLLTGPAMFLGNRTVITLMPAIGGSAIKGGALAGAGEFPIELSASTDIGRSMRLNLFSRPQWVFSSASRKHGSKHVPFGDEWTNGGWLAFGRRSSGGESSGLMLGFSWQELMGTHLYTGLIGYHGAFFETPD